VVEMRRGHQERQRWKHTFLMARSRRGAAPYSTCLAVRIRKPLNRAASATTRTLSRPPRRHSYGPDSVGSRRWAR